MRYYYSLAKMAKIKKNDCISVGKDEEKLEFSYSAAGNMK